MQNLKIGAQLPIINLKINKYKEFNSSIKQLFKDQGSISWGKFISSIIQNSNSSIYYIFQINPWFHVSDALNIRIQDRWSYLSSIFVFLLVSFTFPKLPWMVSSLSLLESFLSHLLSIFSILSLKYFIWLQSDKFHHSYGTSIHIHIHT